MTLPSHLEWPQVAGIAVAIATLAIAACDSPPDAAVEANRSTPEQSDTARAGPLALEARLVEAESIYREAEFELAGERFESLLATAEVEGDSVIAAHALTWLGLAAWRLGEYADARRYGEQALALKETIGLREEISRSHNALGLLAWNEGRLLDARAHYGDALTVGHELAEPVDIARASNNLALLETDLGEYASARAHFEEARIAYQALERTDLEARVLTNLGALYVDLGDPVRAESVLRQALDLYAVDPDPVGEVNALGQLGVVFAVRGSPGASLAYLDSALALSREHGLRQEEASNIEQIAEVHRQLGASRLALQLLDEAMAINEEVGLESEIGSDLRIQAEIHSRLGNLELALELLDRASEIHREVGATGEQLGDLLLLAELSGRAGRRANANRYLESAGQIAAELESRSAAVAVALARARKAAADEDPAGALAIVDQIEGDLELGTYAAELEADMLRTDAHRALGDLPAAAAAGRSAVAAVERIRGSLGSSLLAAGVAEERGAAYATLVEILLELGEQEEAFEIADASRGRLLLRHALATSHPSGTSDPSAVADLAAGEDILHRIEGLVRSIDALDEEQSYEHTSERAAEIAALTEVVQAQRLAYSGLIATTRRSGAVDLALLGARAPDLDDIRGSLADNEVLVQLMMTEDRLNLFVLRPDSVFTASVAETRADLVGRVRIARDLLADPHSDESLRSSVLAGLFETIVRPLAEAGALEGAETLILVPDGELIYLPFAALIDERTDRFLVQDYAILDLPSAASLPVLRQRAGDLSLDRNGDRVATRARDRRDRDSRVRGAGFAPFPAELPASVEEVERFASTVRGSETLIGRPATERALRENLVATEVVHAATHGVLNARNPLFSRLELAAGSGDAGDDGRLEVHELLAQRVDSDLVFLSGCDTGAAAAWAPGVAGGEDYATLAQAFLFAGARNVVATLWPIRDRAAAAFTDRFYELTKTLPVAEALAETQRWALEQPGLEAPFFWASHRVSGDGLAGGFGPDA